MRRYFHRKINRWDAATNVLLVEKRQEALREYQREKREYVKRKASYWIGEASRKLLRKFPAFQLWNQTLTLAQLKKKESYRTPFLSN